jgi:Rrf2 family iron-sulfur cluster assembly transcriptional regulator
MLQISRRADYAVRVMLELGSQPEGTLISGIDLSRRIDVSKPFLHKIIADLAKNGLVRTHKGSLGGLAISRPAHMINMRQILEAVDGPICLNICLLRPSECPRDTTCPGHEFWGQMQMNLIQQLEETTLDDLITRGRELAQHAQHDRDIPYVYPENSYGKQLN